MLIVRHDVWNVKMLTGVRSTSPNKKISPNYVVNNIRKQIILNNNVNKAINYDLR